MDRAYIEPLYLLVSFSEGLPIECCYGLVSDWIQNGESFSIHESPVNCKVPPNISPLNINPPNISPPKMLTNHYKPRAYIRDCTLS